MKMKYKSIDCLGYYDLSTYDYVMNRRMNQTIDQTVFQFNQLNQNHYPSSLSNHSMFSPQQVRNEIKQ